VRRRLLALVTALALLAVSGCDVPTNDEPTELSGPFSRLDTTTTSSTTSPQVDGREAIVYMLRAEDGATVLESITRRVDSEGGVQENLRNLFSQPPATDDPAEADLTTAIPAGATLLAAEASAVDADRLIVDVRGLFGDQGPQGVTLRNALAQIVWTATHPTTGFTEVVFRNDGQPADALVDNLETTGDAVSRDDYARSIS